MLSVLWRRECVVDWIRKLSNGWEEEEEEEKEEEKGGGGGGGGWPCPKELILFSWEPRIPCSNPKNR